MTTRDLGDMVGEIVTNKTIVTADGMRHACRLLLAYLDYNDAALAAKEQAGAHGDQRKLMTDMMATLNELTEFIAECECAWREYQGADWSRGAFDVWNANNDRFCAELGRLTRALRPLAEKHFGAALAEKHFGPVRE